MVRLRPTRSGKEEIIPVLISGLYIFNSVIYRLCPVCMVKEKKTNEVTRNAGCQSDQHVEVAVTHQRQAFVLALASI